MMWMPQITLSLLFLRSGVTASSAQSLEWKVRLSFIQERNSRLVWSEAAPLTGVTPTDAQVGRKASALKSVGWKANWERVRDEMDGEAERWDGRRSPGGAMGSRADRVDGKSVRSYSSLSVCLRSAAVSWCNSSSLCFCRSSFIFLVLKDYFH